VSLSRDEAAANLRTIEQAGQRSAQALGYARSSPYFSLWGVIWILGYAGSDLLPRLGYSPRNRNWLWLTLSLVGIVGTILISNRQHRAQYAADADAKRRAWLRWVGGAIVVSFFVTALRLAIGPRFEQLASVFFPLLVALFYGLASLKLGVRYFVASIAVTALTLSAYLYLPEYFLLWMAAAGGGSLILVGLWMSKV